MMKRKDTDFSGVVGKSAGAMADGGESNPEEGHGGAACANALSVTTTDGTGIVSPVSFVIASGEILGLVGESGCGKTTLALALLGFAQRGLKIAAGEVTIGPKDLLTLAPRELRQVRGRVVSYVSQDPGTALNPGRRIGRQLDEMLRVHHVGRDRADRTSAPETAYGGGAAAKRRRLPPALLAPVVGWPTATGIDRGRLFLRTISRDSGRAHHRA